MGEVVAFPASRRPPQEANSAGAKWLAEPLTLRSRRSTNAFDRLMCRLGRHTYRFGPDPGWSPFSAEPPERVRLCTHCLAWPPEVDAAPSRHRLGAVALACVLLSACATKPTQLPPPAPVAASACPHLRTYSPAQQAAINDAYKALAAQQPNNPLIGLVIDYGQLRDGTRACLAAK
jgi:hypothetical protein